MNENQPGPGTSQGTLPGPAPAGHQLPPPPHQDLDRLRRSVNDRYVAGVAGGLGRHFGIDPTVIRVLFAVLTFFGGAGVLVYGVCWLFVPEDGHDRAAIHVGSEPRKLVILAAVGIGFLLAVGDAFSGFNAGWPIASIAVIIAIVLIARDRSENKKQAAGTGQDHYHPAYAAAPAAPADPATALGTDAGAPVSPAVGDAASYGSVPPTPPAPPSWYPPQPPLVPPRPKRTGMILFWPTLALIAIGLGIVGIVDADNEVAAAAYPLVALAVTGVMLLIGSIKGRPGGLIFLGFVSTFVLSVATVVGGFNFNGQDFNATPRSAVAVEPSYSIDNGRLRLDLSQLADPEALAGRELDISLKAGEIVVIVPKEINVDLEAEFDFAGGMEVPGYEGGGIQDSVDRNLVGTDNTSPPLELNIEATVGHIKVVQR